MKRTPLLIEHDLSLLSQEGFINLIGLDEVGRGAFAGDLFVCAFHVKNPKKSLKDSLESTKNNLSLEVNDSKKLSTKKREELFEFLAAQEKEYKFSLERIPAELIDKKGMSFCLDIAFGKALESLVNKIKLQDFFVLVDGNRQIKSIKTHKQLVIKKGDSKSFHIAAASIIAKVSRDKYMCELDSEYPVYGWHENKGYGTENHVSAILKHGISAEHRRLFLRKLMSCEKEQQLKLL